eukprot:g25824.t1
MSMAPNENLSLSHRYQCIERHVRTSTRFFPQCVEFQFPSREEAGRDVFLGTLCNPNGILASFSGFSGTCWVTVEKEVTCNRRQCTGWMKAFCSTVLAQKSTQGNLQKKMIGKVKEAVENVLFGNGKMKDGSRMACDTHDLQMKMFEGGKMSYTFHECVSCGEVPPESISHLATKL